MDLGLLLGRFHVLVLHLPLGIIIAGIVLECLALTPRFRQLTVAAPALWALAAVTALLTVALGVLHAGEGGFDVATVAAHRFWGIALALSTCAVWLGRAPLARVSRSAPALAALVLLPIMVLAGHYGGKLTHGETFLTEHAPFVIRGAPEQSAPQNAATSVAPELEAAGLRVRAVSLEAPPADAGLIVGGVAPGAPLRAGALEALAASSRRIVELDLPGAGLTDADVAFLPRLAGLEVLRLDMNSLTDETVRALAGSPSLRVLNVYGNIGITDASIDVLAGMPALEAVYAWQTGITAEGAAGLRRSRPMLHIELGTTFEEEHG